MADRYDAKNVEHKWSAFWDKEKIYAFDEKGDNIYAVDTPPPTVSGNMHLGHAFSYAQQDFLIRYKRMRGHTIFYPFGTDDNGLPTERLIERLKKVKSTSMKRKEFVALCLKTLDEIRPDFVQDWKNLGISCDFDMFYTTISDHSRKISQKSFIDLYKHGREYRKEAPSIWCPECQTAIAQVELEDKELASTFNDIIFEAEDGTKLVIATTRPELLPACVAIFVHPDDNRYKRLVGKKARVPLFGQEVEIKTDKRADPGKGTGMVMCCTFGDQTDIEWYKAHNLPLIIAITKDGKMTGEAGEYAGMPIKKARKAILEKLEEGGLLVAQKDIIHPVNVHERCGVEVEILETKQWFIKYLDIKEKLLKAGKEMNWYPKHMRVRYDNWIQGLQWDWCISRQRHFGIPIPVWYCKKCDATVLPDEKDLPVDPTEDKIKKKCECGCTEFIPEKDVLDTWATSALTPQIAIQLMKNPDKLFPMQLRPQAHDIITFWLFNTVVKSQLHEAKNPWEDIVISGFVLDPKGKKMSKSKGNVVAPQDMIGKYSADALRFWAAGSKLGDDMPFQEKDLKTGQKMVTKLFNAARFVSMHLEKADMEKIKKVKKLETLDKAILSRLQKLVQGCTESFDKYEYSKTKLETEKFFWQMMCDNYLEIVKDRLYNPEERGEDGQLSAQYTLYTMLYTIIRLLAPIMPFITEELYQNYYREHEGHESVHVAPWPELDKKIVDEESEQAGNLVLYATENARRAKSEQQLSLKTPIKDMLLRSKLPEKLFEQVKADIIASTHAENITYEVMKKDSELDYEHKITLAP